MGAVIADRVKDTTTTTGTGTVTLSGTAPAGFQAFASAMAVGDFCMYCIAGGTDWEVGIGTLLTATTLSRDTVSASSNAGALVSLAAGTKDVFITVSARELETRGKDIAFAIGRALN